MKDIDNWSTITIEKDGGLRIVRLNIPDKLNAISEQLHNELTRIWWHLAQDRDARAIVLTGEGRAFSAGGDAKWLESITADPEARWRSIDEGRRLVREILHCPLPIVAAVNGAAIGLGASIASLCDLVVMSEKAYFSDPHVALGIAAGDGAAGVWPATIGVLRAKEYILFGDRITAEEALRLGLANRVVPQERLMDEAIALANRLASIPTAALRTTKRAINMHVERATFGVLDYALATESEHFTLPDIRESLAKLKKS